MSLTKIVRINPLNPEVRYLQEAVDILESGGLVIIPTETVYGIAADALNQKAVERLAEIKKRAKDKPFTIAIERREKIDELAREVPVAAYKLIDKFWPGPLTLILKGINQSTIGLRMPDNKIALQVIAGVGKPLVLPSANLSGSPAPENFEAAIRDLNGLVDLAIDSGALKFGIESTIVDLTAEIPQVIRLGAINDEEINKAIVRKNILFVCTGNTCRSVIAETLFKKMMRDNQRFDVEVFSAGVMTLSGIGASQSTKDILAREGINASGHVAREVTREMLQKSDLILVMERLHEEAVLKLAPEVKNRVFLLKEFARIDENNLDIVDPMGKSMDFYEKTFASIKEALERVSKLI
ncbi:MAG: L-threonylcarbamoyladenylate synthase [Candidatus Omnitrophota bacterium]|nr:L-threonylcarbamoyladenylate synthase [Candidatus Omnitrophota bacterium]